MKGMDTKWLKKSFYTVEPWVFLIVALANLLPIFAGQYFPTLDGAAHLYNANIIKDLLLNPESAFADYFEFNSNLVPNWSGHLILVFFRLFFRAFIAEKCLLLIYLLGLPYAFRGLVYRINPSNLLATYLIFPFCYTAVFLFGFYNFSIGVLLMFLIFSTWVKWENRRFSLKKIALFLLLFLLLYFSHLVVFAITIGLLLGRSFYLAGYDYLFKKELKKQAWKTLLNEFGFLLLTALLPFILLINYFLTRNVFASSTRLSMEKLIEGLTNMESLIGFNYDLEKKFTFYFFCSLAMLLLYILIKRILLFVSRRKLIQQSDYWLLAAIGVLMFYFILPNESGSAGYISIRLNLIFYLLLICWIVSQQIEKPILVILTVVVLHSNFKLNQYYYSVSNDLNRYTEAITACSKHINEESTVVPLNYSQNWITYHFSNYLGADKQIMLMDNYESTLDYFPIQLKKETFPKVVIGLMENQECTSWLSNKGGVTQVADYVFILDQAPEGACDFQIKKELDKVYELVYLNDLVELYKRKG